MLQEAQTRIWYFGYAAWVDVAVEECCLVLFFVL